SAKPSRQREDRRYRVAIPPDRDRIVVDLKSHAKHFGRGIAGVAADAARLQVNPRPGLEINVDREQVFPSPSLNAASFAGPNSGRCTPFAPLWRSRGPLP